METLRCPKCNVIKTFVEFRKHHRQGPYEEWNLRVCKSCVHEEYISMRNNPEQYKNQLEASLNWKKSNPEKHAALARDYREKNPEKIIAQNRLNYAVKKGRVKKMPCEICGTAEKVHAHHASYEPKDWYNVKWLCFVCHKLEHHEQD